MSLEAQLRLPYLVWSVMIRAGFEEHPLRWVRFDHVQLRDHVVEAIVDHDHFPTSDADIFTCILRSRVDAGFVVDVARDPQIGIIIIGGDRHLKLIVRTRCGIKTTSLL